MKLGHGVGFKPESQCATEDQLSQLTMMLPVIQRVQPSAFRTLRPLEAPDGIQYLKGPEWLWWAEVKVCLVQELKFKLAYIAKTRSRCQNYRGVQ